MAASVEPGTWKLEPSASSISLKHKTMWGTLTVRGVFTAFSGEGEVSSEGSARGSVTLDAASLDTKNAKRDAHLRSADFFDVENHPAITFTAQRVEAKPDGTAKVDGQLSVRGIARPYTLTARVTPRGRDTVILETQFPVERDQFEMGWNQMGMLRGATTVTATLGFSRTGDA